MMTPYNSSYRNISLLNRNEPVKQFVEPEPLRCFRLFVLAVVIVGSLVGNTVVIRAVVRAKGAKSATYFLISNLALAEIISSSCLPFLQSYAELLSWPFPEAMCHLINPLQMTAGMVVTTSIASIAVVRCLFMQQSLTFYRKTYFDIVAKAVGVAMWIAAFIFFLPYFLHMTKIPSFANDGKFWCLLLLPGDKLNESYPSRRQKRYIIAQLIVNYILPFTITLICYALVISKFRSYRLVSIVRNIKFRDTELTQTEATGVETESGCEVKDIRDPEKLTPPTDNFAKRASTVRNIEFRNTELAQTKTTDEETEFGCDVKDKEDPEKPTYSTANDSAEPKVLAQDADEFKEYESDLLKMFYAIVLTFILCYIPYQCFFVLEYIGRLSWKNWRYFDVTRSYLYLLTCFPSALHPICYGVMSRFYRKAFSKLILCR